MQAMTGYRRMWLAAALAVSGLSAASAAPADPSGTYLTEDGRARIRVEPCGRNSAQMCGYVVWMKSSRGPGGEPLLDSKNPDPAKAGRPVLGHQLMMGLRAKDTGYEGRIYNNEDGKSYNVTIWLEGSDLLKVRGCLVAFLCSTQDWKRTRDVAAGQLAGATGGASGPAPDPEYAALSAPGASAAAGRKDTKRP